METNVNLQFQSKCDDKKIIIKWKFQERIRRFVSEITREGSTQMSP